MAYDSKWLFMLFNIAEFAFSTKLKFLVKSN